MTTLLRRTFWLALIGGVGFVVWSWWQRQQQQPTPSGAPEWPPLDPPTAPTTAPTTSPSTTATPPTATAPFTTTPADEARWVAPVEGGCPDGYPVKANDNSGIYHVPGGRFYDRTGPERCYARAEDAEADGYRAAKA